MFRTNSAPLYRQRRANNNSYSAKSSTVIRLPCMQPRAYCISSTDSTFSAGRRDTLIFLQICHFRPTKNKNSRPIPNPTQPNPWVNPTHGQLWARALVEADAQRRVCSPLGDVAWRRRAPRACHRGRPWCQGSEHFSGVHGRNLRWDQPKVGLRVSKAYCHFAC